MRAHLNLVLAAVLASCATAAAKQTGERHGGWVILRNVDAFEQHRSAGSPGLTSETKDGATLSIQCDDERGLGFILSLKGLKAINVREGVRRVKVLIKVDDRPAQHVTGEIPIPDAAFLNFKGAAAKYFEGARHIGIRVKDDMPDGSEKNRDEFFSVPPMDKQVRSIFESGCRAS